MVPCCASQRRYMLRVLSDRKHQGLCDDPILPEPARAQLYELNITEYLGADAHKRLTNLFSLRKTRTALEQREKHLTIARSTGVLSADTSFGASRVLARLEKLQKPKWFDTDDKVYPNWDKVWPADVVPVVGTMKT